jgi:hypothetical protein
VGFNNSATLVTSGFEAGQDRHTRPLHPLPAPITDPVRIRAPTNPR